MEQEDPGAGLQKESSERQQHVQLWAHGVAHQCYQRHGPRAPGPAPNHQAGTRARQRPPDPAGVREERLRVGELPALVGTGAAHPGGGAVQRDAAVRRGEETRSRGGGGEGDGHVTSPSSSFSLSSGCVSSRL